MVRLLSFTLIVFLSESLFANIQNLTVKGSEPESRQNYVTTGAPVPARQQGNGTLVWFGTVDDDVHLLIQDGRVRVRTNAGTEYLDQIYGFASPLPRREVKVSVKKKDGRGTAAVIQQPAAGNDFTAIVQILDKNGGAKEYELEIQW